MAHVSFPLCHDNAHQLSVGSPAPAVLSLQTLLILSNSKLYQSQFFLQVHYLHSTNIPCLILKEIWDSKSALTSPVCTMTPGPFCTLITNTGATEEEAVARLTRVWNQENHARKEAWAWQLKEDQQAAGEEDRLARELEQNGLDVAHHECEKKKPKINNFDINSSIGSYITPRPSTYAINKLESFDYVELFYFTWEGCLNALNNHHTEADNTYSLSSIGDLVSLCSILAVKASKNVVQDIDLTWAQMMFTKTSYLQHLGSAGWPQKHIDALTHFFVSLEASSFCGQSHGERVLITYQAQVWHHCWTLHSPTIPGGFLFHSWFIPKVLVDSSSIPSIPTHSQESWYSPDLSWSIPYLFPHQEWGDVIYHSDWIFELSLEITLV